MTRVETNAITWLAEQGFKPVMGGFRDMHNFQLYNKDTKEVENFDIDQVLADYKQNQKDEARMRAAEKTASNRGVNSWSSTR